MTGAESRERVVAIVQARVSSSRLPGKVLADVAGRPLLAHLVERLRRARRLDEIVLATSSDPSDDPLEAFARSEALRCFRGSLHDVLDRYVRAAESSGATQVVRVTGDSPFTEPRFVDLAVEHHLRGGFDLTCAKDRADVIPGTGNEVVRVAALQTAWRQGRSPEDREHVTWYLLAHRDRFRVAFYCPDPAARNPGITLTVDEPDDLELARAVARRLGDDGAVFGVSEIVALYRQEPALFRINERVARKPHLFVKEGAE